MAKQILSHFSPVLANKHWNEESHYACYYRDIYSGQVKFEEKGKKQWGRERGLYTLDVEKSLAEKLESPVGGVYEKILNFHPISRDDRSRWSQFLLSQLVRTPTYLKYEKFLMNEQSIFSSPNNDRVGCLECLDLQYLSQRKWKYLISHEDDYFVRTDNPIFQTGFLERSDSCFYYPLHPRVCFVACSMDSGWSPKFDCDIEYEDMVGIELEKGMAWQLNFYMARSAGNSLITKPSNNTDHAENMYKQILGIYPQPPFDLVSFGDQGDDQKFEYIRSAMSRCDDSEYPKWTTKEIEPFI